MKPDGALTPVLSAGPLTLRPWRLDGFDTDLVLHAARDLEIARYSTVGSARDPASAERWLMQRHDHDRCDWVMQLDREPVGRVSVASIDREGSSAELGYWVLPEHRRLGYALQGISEVMRFAAEDLGLRHLRIEHERENRPSCSLALRLGFGRCEPSPEPVVVAGMPRLLWVHHTPTVSG